MQITQKHAKIDINPWFISCRRRCPAGFSTRMEIGEDRTGHQPGGNNGRISNVAAGIAGSGFSAGEIIFTGAWALRDGARWPANAPWERSAHRVTSAESIR